MTVRRADKARKVVLQVRILVMDVGVWSNCPDVTQRGFDSLYSQHTAITGRQ